MKTFVILCRNVGGKATTGQTTCLNDLKASIIDLMRCYDHISVWELGHSDNELWNSIRMAGDTCHTVRCNALPEKQVDAEGNAIHYSGSTIDYVTT